ncbi:MAG: RagB/SusD family nutrient uptake outer membrane protein [Mangrovibacterium sp.]
MKNISIRRNLGVLLICLSALASCENYLDQESKDKITTDQVWNSYDAAESYLISAYSFVQPTGWQYHEYFYLPQNFRGDDMFPENGTNAWGYLAQIVGFNNTASSSVPTYMWTNWYEGVKLANDVIENVPNMSMITQDDRDQLIAEARFLRAFYFLNLQMNFHSIIMPTKVATSPDDLQIPASNKEDVYTQIISDFTFAAEHLPAKSMTDSWGRAGADAAYAFLGKSCLYAAKYQDALDAFSHITDRSLVDGSRYRSMFDGTAESNSEVIFTRGYTAEQQEILELYHQLGVALAPASLNGGWEMASISDYYMSQLESGDIRKSATVLQNGETFDGQTITFDNPNFKMSIKYVESLDAISSNRSVVDIILMRYADVLLMEAEANYELNNVTEANKRLNEIRSRAGLSEIILSGTELRDEIRKQRMIELVGEDSRFYDLVRWGIVTDQLTTAKQPFARNFESKYSFFPIPLVETQRNKLVEPTPGF